MVRTLKETSKWPLCKVLVLSMAACAAGSAAAQPADTSATSLPPGYTTTRTGTVHDFEYFTGGWTIKQHRLKKRGVGSNEWEDFPATLCMSPYLDGMITVDEL